MELHIDLELSDCSPEAPQKPEAELLEEIRTQKHLAEKAGETLVKHYAKVAQIKEGIEDEVC